MSRDFFCERCSLQFGKQYVFDLHLSLVHGETIEVKNETVICEEIIQFLTTGVNKHYADYKTVKFKINKLHLLPSTE